MVEPAQDIKVLTLAGIADGAAEELFADALAKVVANINDPNTDHKAERRITLTFAFDADEERRVGDVEIKCALKLAAIKGTSVGVYFGRHEGVLTAVEAPKQTDMFTKPNPARPTVVGGQGDKI